MRCVLLVFILTVSHGWTSGDSRIDYNNHQVVRVVPRSDVELTQLKLLIDSFQADVWSPPGDVNVPVDFRIAPGNSDSLWNELDRLELDASVMIGDVQRLIDNERNGKSNERLALADLDTDRYYSVDEINDFLKESVSNCGSDCALIELTDSCLGDNVNIIKIGRAGEKRPAVWIDGGVHAREWIAPAVAMYIIERLISDDDTDDDVTLLRDSYDWYINPVVNPDGYAYTWTTDRLWRKTRCDHGNACVGVDGNRNFDFMWDVEGGASDSPCSSNYRGPQAFSEPETESIADLILGVGGFRLLFNLHSYGQILLHPWGHTHDYESIHYDELVRLAEIGVDAINSVHDAGYTYGQTTGIMSGSTMDWGHGAAGIIYSYTLELRDTGEYGFILPESLILPTDEEAWAGVKAMALDLID